ncbi:MAG: hypothetical protein N2Z60_06260 [Elusimicrobiales bacterium]|nr:hypothetical protein [Elusimicrobiales bacterium]
MKKFKLETLLKLRKNEENAEMIKLSELKKIREKQTAMLIEKEKELRKNIEDLRNLKDEFIAQNAENYIKQILLDIEEIKKEIDVTDKKIEEQKIILNKASVNRKKIEEFKKRFLEKIKKEEENKENKNLEEFAIAIFNRRRR